MKSKIIGIALSSFLLLGSVPAFAADNAVDPNQTVDPNNLNIGRINNSK